MAGMLSCTSSPASTSTCCFALFYYQRKDVYSRNGPGSNLRRLTSPPTFNLTQVESWRFAR